ncbi:MAG: carbon-nitrogen hydrolase family protein [Gammaproteobacteria bacterium]|nr:carbon-nitrogen hydrolase family protein [Gammaproteobacteria bacterium]
MAGMFRAACIQNCAADDLRANLAEVSTLVTAAARDGAALICLPEYFCCIEQSDRRYLAHGYGEETHPAVLHFRDRAAALGVWLLLGSVCLRRDQAHVRNRSMLLNAAGEIVARYDKMHLFDVELGAGESYRESDTVVPGEEMTLAATPWGLLGMSICYDLRFAYLYRALARAGATFLTVPAAFTQQTGAAHWHVLLRARAIETGCYVIAPGQCGVRPWGRATYGHSLIVDPWGVVLADGGTEPGYVIAEIDPAAVTEARRRIPALHHDRAMPPMP